MTDPQKPIELTVAVVDSEGKPVTLGVPDCPGGPAYPAYALPTPREWPPASGPTMAPRYDGTDPLNHKAIARARKKGRRRR